MAKVQFSDVTPPEKRSIRDIPIPTGGKRKTPIVIKPGVPKPNLQSENEVRSQQPVSNLIDVDKDSGPYEYYYPKDKKVSSPTSSPINSVNNFINPPKKSSANSKRGKKGLFIGLA